MGVSIAMGVVQKWIVYHGKSHENAHLRKPPYLLFVLHFDGDLDCFNLSIESLSIWGVDLSGHQILFGLGKKRWGSSSNCSRFQLCEICELWPFSEIWIDFVYKPIQL